jgi:hypothetical protein
MHPLLESFGLYAIDNGMSRTITFDVQDDDRPRGAPKIDKKHVIGVYYLPSQEIHVVALGTVLSAGPCYRAVPVDPGTFDEDEGSALLAKDMDEAIVWLQQQFRDRVEALTMQAGAVGEA